LLTTDSENSWRLDEQVSKATEPMQYAVGHFSLTRPSTVLLLTTILIIIKKKNIPKYLETSFQFTAGQVLTDMQ